MATRICRTIAIFTVLMFMSRPPVFAQTTAPGMSGFMKLSWRAAPESDSEMKVSAVRVRMKGAIDDKTTYTFFVDAMRDEVLLDAAICREILPSLTLTAGQYKTPFSTDNLLPAWKYPFIARGYLKSAVSPPFRDIGVTLTHNSKYLELTTAVMNGAGANYAETNGNKAVTCRAVGHVTGWLSLSGNYSRGEVAGDGGITEFYNAGCDGLIQALWYESEYARKEHAGITADVAAAWVSCDWNTGSASLPVLTPALKCEWYDPDRDRDDNAIISYTAGLSVHLAEKDTNRIMINYLRKAPEVGDADDSVTVEYLVRY